MSGSTLPSFTLRPSRSGLLASAGFLIVAASLALGMANGSNLGALVLALLAGALSAAVSAAVARFIFRRRERLAEQAVDQLWQSLADDLPVALALVDRSGRMVRANEAFHLLLPDAGRAPLVVLRQRLADADVLSGVVARLSLALSEGRSSETEVQLAGADDIWRISAVALGDPGDHALWLIDARTSMLDRATGSAEPTTGDAAAAAGFGQYLAASDGRIIALNRVLAEWLGPAIGPGARIGDASLRGGELDGRLVRSPGASVLLRGADGRALACRALEFPTRAGDHAPVIGLVWRSEAELMEGPFSPAAGAENRFRQAFEAAPVAVAVLDDAGRIILANPALRAFIGRDVGERPIADLIAQADVEAAAAWLRQVVAGNGARDTLDIALKPAEGGEGLAATLYARPLPLRDGRIGVVVHLLDARERRRLEREAAYDQRIKMLGMLAASVAHDFNHHLHIILTACEGLLVRHGPTDPSFAELTQILQSVHRATQMVSTLLASGRQQTLLPRIIDVTNTLGEMSHMLRRQLGPGIKLVVQHGRDLGAVNVDQNEFERVITNLAVNARDAMDRRGTLTIRTANRTLTEAFGGGPEEAPPGDYVAIEVADTGSGIPPEVLPHIFDPGFTTKPVGAGTGLGLAGAFGSVRQSGGYMLVDTAPGKGTTFTVLLPRHAHLPVARPMAAAEPARRDLTGSGTILLVEDEDLVRKPAAKALRLRGYTVIEADTGVRALELLEQEDAVDLLITDVMMPEMDGATLLRRVRVLRPQLRAICISGHAEESFRQEIGAMQDLVFLGKPFSHVELARLVKDLLQAAKAA